MNPPVAPGTEVDSLAELEGAIGALPSDPLTDNDPKIRSVKLQIKTPSVEVILVALAVTAFLYFAKPVMLPIFLASMATMALKPMMRWLGFLRIPTPASAALVMVILIAALGVGFSQLGRPAVLWIEDAPQHMTDLRSRFQKLFPTAVRTTKAMNEVMDLGMEGDKKDGPKKVATVEVKDSRGTDSILNWTETLVAGLVEVFVLIYLLLASGDLLMLKLVHVMPTLKDKKRAVEISHDVQQNISNYLFSVTAINIGLGVAVAVGLYFIGVPKPAMWGMLAAVLNFVPYIGPIAGVLLLTSVGLLTFDTLWIGLLPALWYLVLHLLESNIVTPILLGRRFALSPVAIFISLMFWLWMWGIPGALLSVPILVSVKSICDRIDKASVVSEMIGR